VNEAKIYRLRDILPDAGEGGRGKTFLTDEASADFLAVDYIRIRPGNAGEYHVHNKAHNIWIVLEGELTAVVGERRYIVRAGEVIFMPAAVPHMSSNEGTADMLGIEIYCPPHRKMPMPAWDMDVARKAGTLDSFTVELPARIVDAPPTR
jgi:mannose-6-phosphate isomerase-like protein (cupin superfamily)